MQKLECPYCHEPLDSIICGTPETLEWDPADDDYMYHDGVGDRECSCPECHAALPRTMTDPILDRCQS